MCRFYVSLLLTSLALVGTAGPAAAQPWPWYRNAYHPWYSYGYYVVDPVPARLVAQSIYNRSLADSYKVFMEAEIVKQQALQERLVTYHKTLETMEYGIRKEAELAIYQVETRIEKDAQLVALEATRAEIETGKALRTMRLYLNGNLKKLEPSVSEEISKECLRNISFKIGRYEQGGLLPLLRDGKIAWPGILQDKIFEKERVEFDGLLEQVMNQVKASGGVSQEQLGRMKAILVEMDDILEKNWGRVVVARLDAAERWDHPDFFRARRFVKDDLRRGLGDLMLTPDEFLAVTRTPDATNVVRLLKHMNDSGLEFAPACGGQAKWYHTLYRAMADEAKKIRTLNAGSTVPH